MIPFLILLVYLAVWWCAIAFAMWLVSLVCGITWSWAITTLVWTILTAVAILILRSDDDG